MARLLFFGKLGDLAGGRERDYAVPAEVNTLDDLIRHLAAQDEVLGAALAEISVRAVVNEQIASRSSVISDADEIAFLPPPSGG